MAKVAIKSEKLTPFGGIFSIMEQFDSKEQTLYSHLASKVRYISHLGHTPNIAEPHVFKQGALHCLATTQVVTITGFYSIFIGRFATYFCFSSSTLTAP